MMITRTSYILCRNFPVREGKDARSVVEAKKLWGKIEKNIEGRVDQTNY